MAKLLLLLCLGSLVFLNDRETEINKISFCTFSQNSRKMKKIIIAFLGLTLTSNLSCSKTQDAPPAEQSIVSTGDSGDKVLIRLKPKVGDNQKTLMTMNMTSEEDGGIVMQMSVKMNVDVSAKDADIYTYLVKYNSVKMNMDVGGMEMSYDSENPGQSPMGQMMHQQMGSFLDKNMTLKMSDRGEVKEFSLPGNASIEQMGDMGSLSIPLPEEPVGVGDTWSSVRTFDKTGTMKMNMKVESISVDDLVIGTMGEILSDEGTKVGTFDGNYKLDRSSGLTKDGTMNMNLTADGKLAKMKINFKSI